MFTDPTRKRGVVAAAVATLALFAVFVICLYMRQRWRPLHIAWLWGLVLIACFAGWGAAFNQWFFPDDPVDWGLRAAWGTALTIIVGGVLCFFAIATRPVLLVWVAAGLLSLGDHLLMESERIQNALQLHSFKRLFRWTTPVTIALLVMIGIQYVGAAVKGGPNPSDDFVAYLTYPHMMLSSGTFIDPFSLRRMVAYGGQSFLHALTFLAAQDLQVHLLDTGICWLMLLGLTAGHFLVQRRASRVVLVVLILMLVTLPEVRINSTSEISGALLFLALFRTADWLGHQRQSSTSSAFVLAMLAAAVATLRQSYILVAGVFLVVSYMHLAATRRALGPSQDTLAQFREFVICGALTTLCLVPWAALAFRSNHTVLFPVFAGNYTHDYGALSSVSDPLTRLNFFLACMTNPDPIRTLPLFVLLGLALRSQSSRGALRAFWVAGLLGFVVLVYSLPQAGPFEISRYDYAYLVAYVVATTLIAANIIGETASGRDRKSSWLAALIIIFALVGQVIDVRGSVAARYRGYLENINASGQMTSPLETPSPAYQLLQQKVPPKEKLLVMVERPYWLDYGRNTIYHLDLPGAVSPPPGLPLFQGAEAVAKYLLAQGIRYVAFTRPEKSENDLYRRAHWQKQLTAGAPIWKFSAKFYLAIFDDLNSLALSRKPLHDDGHLVLVDLATSH